MKLAPNTTPIEPADLLIRLHNQVGASSTSPATSTTRAPAGTATAAATTPNAPCWAVSS